MRLLGWWQVLLWVLGSPARGLEVAEEGSHLQSEEQPAHALLAGVVSTSEEEHPRGPGGQDRSAGEAGTVLGLDADGDHVLMLSVIPGETDDKLSSEPSGGTCGAQGGGGLAVQPPRAPLLWTARGPASRTERRSITQSPRWANRTRPHTRTPITRKV